VALAEEYRKTGRFAEALSTLQKGLLAHPRYVSAQVAQGRAYLESGQITEAIATFSKVLVADPGNLVSAKSLADIYLSRGESVEAIKKYKLYRALSGDRTVEDIIHRLEQEIAPPPPPPSLSEGAVPPPPSFVEKPTGPIRLSRTIEMTELHEPLADDPFDITSVTFEPPDDSAPHAEEGPFSVLSRDVPLVSPRLASRPEVEEDPAKTRAIRVSDLLGPAAGPAAAPFPTEGPRREEPAAPSEEAGRTLADLYFAQGHYAEALRIYDDLVAANPSDEELKRMRRDAEARLLPAASGRGAGVPDPSLTRRLGRIRALKQWLSVVQAG
jgi:tetratricopeptide (TPR) repeat protein